MLSKASRLTAQDFKGLKTRLAYRGAFFDLSVASGTTTKFACIISKKRIKRAVDRNKAKRKIYTLLQNIHTKTPLFVCMYPTKTILGAPHDKLVDEITKAFATL